MNYKAEAEKIVEMFRNIFFYGRFYTAEFNNTQLLEDTKKCVDAAIKHVEGIIKVIDKIQQFNEYRDYKQILNELKSRL